MKRYNNFIINPLTIIYLLIALIFNKFIFIFTHYLIAFIHEGCHYLAAKILNVKVQEIQFLPIGFYLKITNLENYAFFKQLIVLVSGPLSYFISLAIIQILFRFDVISEYGYQDALITNNFILIFNLLPIYPLDGEKILELLLSHFLNEYRLRIFRVCISLVTLVIASFFLLSLGEIITTVFLFIGIIISIINLKKDYLYFLLFRLNTKNTKKVKINRAKEIFRLNDNYYLDNNKLINEQQIISEIFKQEKMNELVK